MQRMAAATCELWQWQRQQHTPLHRCALLQRNCSPPTLLLPGASHLLVYYFPPCSYGRSFNPTVRYLGRQLAALEGGEAAYCCASGKAPAACRLPRCCLWLHSLTGSCDLQQSIHGASQCQPFCCKPTTMRCTIARPAMQA